MQPANSGWLLPRWEIAHTEVVWNLASQGPPKCGFLDGRCSYKAVDHCTPETTPPDNSFNGDLVGGPMFDGQKSMAFIVTAFCVRGSNSWSCLHGYASLLSVNVPTIPYACRHNP